MLLHQEVSPYHWLEGRGLLEVIAEHGLFRALYTDRASHYFHTAEAGGKVDKTKLTQVGRALQQLGIEHIAVYSPEAGGRAERAFATLEDRLLKELKLAGITTIEAANRFIAEVYLPDHNARFAKPPESAFVPASLDQVQDILCRQEDRLSAMTTPSATTPSRCRSRQAPSGRTSSRPGFGSRNIPTARSPSSTVPGAWPTTLSVGLPSLEMSSVTRLATMRLRREFFSSSCFSRHSSGGEKAGEFLAPAGTALLRCALRQSSPRLVSSPSCFRMKAI